MGTFVPIDTKTGKPLARASAAGPRFVPMDDYSRERRKALEERDPRTPYRTKGGEIKKKTASENLAWGVRNIVPGGGAMLDALPANVKRGLKQGIDKFSDINDAMASEPPLPILDELNAGARAAGNEVVNRTWRAARGEKPVSSEAIYRANMDVDQELKDRKRREMPVSTTAGGILSGLATGPGRGAGAALARANPGATAKVMQWGTNIAKGAGVGAGYGGVYGLLDAPDGERLEGAQEGALYGGLLGGALEGVAPGVALAVRKAKGAYDDLTRVLRKPTAEAEAKLGTDTAVKILQRKGLTPESVRAEKAKYAPGLEPTAAEMGGADVERKLGAIGRQEGRTGDDLLALKEERRAGAGEYALNAADEHLGVRPEFASGDIEAAVARGRETANPEYAAMRAEKAGITSPELEAILQRPHVQSVLKEMERYSGTAGREPYGLAWGDIDVPAAPVGPDDLSFAATGAPESMPVPRGPAEPPSRGARALTALRQSGEGMGLNLDQQGLRLGQRKGGAELNDMANRLYDEGYTPHVLSDDEMAALLENGGARNLFSREADAAAQQRYEARKAAEEFNARGGNPDDLPHPDDYGNAGPAPERPLTEPARTKALTQESWDKVLSGIDQMVQRDVAGRPITTGPDSFKNKAMLQAASDLRAALFGGEGGAPNLAPELRKARDVSGDYQAINSAYNRMKGKLTTKTFGELQRVWNGAKTEAEKNAMRGAIANDINEMVQSGQMKAGRLTTPRAMAKLELLFGRDEAAAFVNRIVQRDKLAASANRMAPTGGSSTFGNLQAGEEVNQGLMKFEDVRRIFGKFKAGQPVAGTLDAISTPLRAGYRYGQTAGLSQNARDAMGEVLMMGPDELIALLERPEFQELPPPVQKVVRQRAVALGLTGGAVGGRLATAEDDQ